MKISDFYKKVEKEQTKKYILVDFDDTVRDSVKGVISPSGKKDISAPDKKSNVTVFKDAAIGLSILKDKGYTLVGISNQNGPVRRRQFSKIQETPEEAEIELCANIFRNTLNKLNIQFPVMFSTDNYMVLVDGKNTIKTEAKNSKKPSTIMPDFIFRKFGNPDKPNSFMIGDNYKNTDKGLASNLGIGYVDPGYEGDGILRFAKKIKTRNTISELSEAMNEGIHDKHRKKAVFIVGSAGSGKTFVSKAMLGKYQFKQLNVDVMFEFLTKKRNQQAKDWTKDVNQTYSDAKKSTNVMFDNWVAGGLPMIVDGTGRHYNKIKSEKLNLEELGYDTYMIFVDVDLDTALKRNRNRERVLDDDYVELVHNEVTNNRNKYIDLFDGSISIINNKDMSQEEFDDMINKESKVFDKWLKNN